MFIICSSVCLVTKCILVFECGGSDYSVIAVYLLPSVHLVCACAVMCQKEQMKPWHGK